MTQQEATDLLTEHNKWRRDNEGITSQPDPILIGKAIDVAIHYMTKDGWEKDSPDNKPEKGDVVILWIVIPKGSGYPVEAQWKGDYWYFYDKLESGSTRYITHWKRIGKPCTHDHSSGLQ